MSPQLLVIIGATASGKSDLAVLCAQKYNGEIISADSRQVYKHLNATTGKITAPEMQGISHYMLDIAEPGSTFTVYDFQEQALQHIEDILKRGKLPIIVGGTGFYIEALLYDNTISQVPADLAYREELAKKDITELQKRLQEHSPEAYDRIDIENPRRLTRALEIIKALGTFPVTKKDKRYDYVMIGIKHSRPKLRERIELRLEKRFPEIIKEIDSLLNQSTPPAWFNAMGLECRHIANMLRNNVSEEQTKKNLMKAIFAYAKRQETWWRRYDEAKWFRENEFPQLFNYLRRTLL